MANKVLVFDTSLFVVWLQVPGCDTGGPKHDLWDYRRIENLVQENKDNETVFVLPLATIIETGNRICRISSPAERRAPAERLTAIIRESVQGNAPWAVFTDQSVLWESEPLLALADQWSDLISTSNPCHSMGDATIKTVAEFYAERGVEVEIITGDTGLKQFQPSSPKVASTPRRRQQP